MLRKLILLNAPHLLETLVAEAFATTREIDLPPQPKK